MQVCYTFACVAKVDAGDGGLVVHGSGVEEGVGGHGGGLGVVHLLCIKH